MSTKDFKEFKYRELKVNILLAFICYTSALANSTHNLGNQLHSFIEYTCWIGSITYYFITLRFLYKYKLNYSTLGYNKFRKYYMRFLYFALLPLLCILTDGHLFGLGDNWVVLFLAFIGYIIFFILVFLPIVNIIVYLVEFMEFEGEENE